MKTSWFAFALVLIVSGFLFSGCGDIANALEKATARTIPVSQTIMDSTNERSQHTATVVNGVLITNSNLRTLSPVSLQDLDEAIEVARLEMGLTRCFINVDMTNRGNSTAWVTLSLSGESNGPVEIFQVALAPFQRLVVNNGYQPGAAGEAIHQNLVAAFRNINDAFQVTPIIQVQGATSEGVLINQIQIGATPTYLKERELNADVAQGNEDYVKGIHDAELTGTVTNQGAGVVQVSIYLIAGEALPENVALVAQATLQPGQSIDGAEMVVPEGPDRLETAFETVIGGSTVYYDYVIVSNQPIKVKSDQLKVKAQIDVEVKIF